MSKDAFEKVKSVLEPYVAISSEIPHIKDKRLPELMLRLVKDNELYGQFEQDPEASIVKAGLDPKKFDVKMFTGLAKLLHERALRRSGGSGHDDGPATAIEQKEKNQGNQNNWDHSKQSYTKYEGQYNEWREKGATKEKQSSESQMTDKGFDKKGIGSLDDSLLEHELNLLFFPAQPLVTPELLEKIKAKLAEKSSD